MNTTNYPGINYAGPGSQTNTNKQTGIRFGVIHTNKLGEFAWDEITQSGTDCDYEEFCQSVRDGLRSALSDYFSDVKYGDKVFSKLDVAVGEAFAAISDELQYESSGDCTRYLYEKDGLKFQVAFDGDIFVLASPWFTYAQFCSPCAPGACYLTSPLDTPIETNKCYCLGGDWFSDDAPMPYPVYSIETGELVQPV